MITLLTSMFSPLSCSQMLQQQDGPRWREKLPSFSPVTMVTQFPTSTPASLPKPQAAQPPTPTKPTLSKEQQFEKHKAEGNDFVKKVHCKYYVRSWILLFWKHCKTFWEIDTGLIFCRLPDNHGYQYISSIVSLTCSSQWLHVWKFDLYWLRLHLLCWLQLQ